MDEQRALLDSLMGINRNHDRKEQEISDFRDPRICKYYLMGMCPHEMFVNTKMDCGPCRQIHSDDLKIEFERAGDPTMFYYEVEREFASRISDADRLIKRARARVEEEKADDGANPEVNPELLRLHAEVERKTAEAEAAGEEGDIDKAQELMISVELLNKEKDAILNRISEQRRALASARTGGDVNKKLRVCDVCGSFLSILDSDKRLADHFMGKQHIGFQLMRDTVEAIKVNKEARRLRGEEPRVADERPGTARDFDRDRRRDRSSSRDRNRRQHSRSPRRDERYAAGYADRSYGGGYRGDRGGGDRGRGDRRDSRDRDRDRNRDRGWRDDRR